jgi:hypothetical protein
MTNNSLVEEFLTAVSEEFDQDTVARCRAKLQNARDVTQSVLARVIHEVQCEQDQGRIEAVARYKLTHCTSD